MNKWIDLRSDTVTNPTDRMREVMFHAEVGDDVYGDDPTLTKLEELAAKKVGKEAALFVPSGTFGNQLALFTHCKRGDEVILGEDCHIVAHEVGAAAVIAGVQLRTLETINGKMNLDKVRAAIREEDIHFPETGLICMENAYSNGAVPDVAYMKSIYDLAKEHDLPVHLDGARLFNAAHSLGLDVKEMTQYTDTVMFCLSKGLCAPVGSILAGSKEFIAVARKKRKLLGGGMRQAGFLGAAGIVAIEEMTERLAVDHENAKYMAKLLGELDGVDVDFDNLAINLVFFKINNTKYSPSEIVKHFHDNGIKINGPEGGMMRFVTHYWIGKEEIHKAVDILKEIL